MLIPVLLLYVCTHVSGKLCEKDQFWSSFLDSCQDCSRCVHPDIVIRPCQGHVDTVCGPLSGLNIDWSWLRTPASERSTSSRPKEMMDTFNENMKEITQHEKHVKEKQKYLQQKLKKESWESSESDEDTEGEDLSKGNRQAMESDEKSTWNRAKSSGRLANHLHKSLEDKVTDDLMALEKQKNLEEPLRNPKRWQHMPFDLGFHFNKEEALDLLESSRKSQQNRTFNQNGLQFDEHDVIVKNFGFRQVEEPLDSVKVERLVHDEKFPERFDATERFVLDWQTAILGVAVASCLIFFLVAAIYTVQHAKHWRKLRHYFNADVEELQAWISSKDSKNKFPHSGVYKTTTEVVHTEGGQCKYLERIINMNGKKKFNRVPSNVYEGEKPLPEARPLTACQPIVHKRLGDEI